MWLQQSDDEQQDVYCHTCGEILKGCIYLTHWKGCVPQQQRKFQPIEKRIFRPLEVKQPDNQLRQQRQQKQKYPIKQQKTPQFEQQEKIRCPLCSKQLTFDELSIHNENCQSNKAQCEHCSEKVPLEEIELHQEKCTKNPRNNFSLQKLNLLMKLFKGINPPQQQKKDPVNELLESSVFPALKNIQKGMKKKQIDKIPIIKYKASEQAEDTCIVCLSHFSEDDPIMKLNCSHIFHEECSKDWLMMNSSCSICKAPISIKQQSKN